MLIINSIIFFFKGKGPRIFKAWYYVNIWLQV